ncbi:zonular occludens toxin domain-containing protein [Paucibacter sp. JuS9]|uniref:zonular occludens toxin domain-containing protein n=1 Tax=Paucibacter sp. JuS9 TaxID=3228748 RepID=UPI003756BF83
MINFLLGAPGGGKSYEATVFHILPALEKGRKVITNLPLDLEKIGQIDAAYPSLIELRTASKREGVKGQGDKARPWRAFEHADDFGDPWRRADGIGPLYVIDECHLAMPKGETERGVEEWFSLHRHENADVLLITQSYGKVSAAIRDLVQVVYRVRKNVALGSMGSYTRKVQDGLRGEVVNTSIRKYEKRFFGLYRSHTRGRSAEELGASDVRPIWMHWSFIGSFICFVLLIGIVASGKVSAPWSVKTPQAVGKSATSVQPQAAQQARPVAAGHPQRQALAPVAASSASAPAAVEPFAGRGLHLTGFMQMGARRIWTFSLSQNGQQIAALTDSELVAAGYEWHGESHCSGRLRLNGGERVVICDAPQVGVNIPTPKKAGEA